MLFIFFYFDHSFIVYIPKHILYVKIKHGDPRPLNLIGMCISKTFVLSTLSYLRFDCCFFFQRACSGRYLQTHVQHSAILGNYCIRILQFLQTLLYCVKVIYKIAEVVPTKNCVVCCGLRGFHFICFILLLRHVIFRIKNAWHKLYLSTLQHAGN